MQGERQACSASAMRMANAAVCMIGCRLNNFPVSLVVAFIDTGRRLTPPNLTTQAITTTRQSSSRILVSTERPLGGGGCAFSITLVR